MEEPDSHENFTGAARRVAQRLMVIGENRLQLLMVEIEEERARIVRAVFLAVGALALGVLASLTLTAIIVIAFWNMAPLIVLGILTALYAGGAVFFYSRLRRLQGDWRLFSETLEQLKKDRECLEKHLN